jgi:3D (Asp-Asp-Asp) domain-containing protein
MNIRIIAMAISMLLSFPIVASNVIIEPEPKSKPSKKLKVRVTAYWCGQDPDTSRFRSSTGYTLKSGRSCAVDPRIIPYGSTVVIDGKEFKAIDTGTDVIRKKASHGKLPVVDLFYKTEKQAMVALDNLPMHPWVEIR